ncbi:MAG TPA: hypothetical protein VK524_25015 [Polyangiaceae bacterium]|nr:hypothetical protein [Polyangiaceae bacterium]
MKRAAILIAVLAAGSPAAADVVVASTSDASSCTVSERAQHTATLRRALDRLIESHLSTGNAHVDAQIERLTVESSGDRVVVSARVRLAISDDAGRILSVVTGNAKVEQSARTFRARPRAMREDAVTSAVEAMFDNLKTAIAPTRRNNRVAASGGR